METFDILKAKIGQKITIFKLSDMGFPNLIHCTLEDVYYKDYAQYTKLLHIQYRPARKRSSYVIRIKSITSLLCYDGYVQLQSDMYVKTLSSKEDVTVRESLLSFDNGYFDIAKASTDHKPFLEIIK